MNYKSNLPLGELICARIKSSGLGVDVELSDQQAEQALRKGYVTVSSPANKKPDDAKNQFSEKSK